MTDPIARAAARAALNVVFRATMPDAMSIYEKDIIVAIAEVYAPTVEALRVAVEAMQDFVDKVESGRARSKDSYGKFRTALARIAEITEGEK